jgi:hypothetical protein
MQTDKFKFTSIPTYVPMIQKGIYLAGYNCTGNIAKCVKKNTTVSSIIYCF